MLFSEADALELLMREDMVIAQIFLDAAEAGVDLQLRRLTDRQGVIEMLQVYEVPSGKVVAQSDGFVAYQASRAQFLQMRANFAQAHHLTEEQVQDAIRAHQKYGVVTQDMAAWRKN